MQIHVCNRAYCASDLGQFGIDIYNRVQMSIIFQIAGSKNKIANIGSSQFKISGHHSLKDQEIMLSYIAHRFGNISYQIVLTLYHIIKFQDNIFILLFFGKTIMKKTN